MLQAWNYRRTEGQNVLSQNGYLFLLLLLSSFSSASSSSSKQLCLTTNPSTVLLAFLLLGHGCSLVCKIGRVCGGLRDSAKRGGRPVRLQPAKEQASPVTPGRGGGHARLHPAREGATAGYTRPGPPKSSNIGKNAVSKNDERTRNEQDRFLEHFLQFL